MNNPEHAASQEQDKLLKEQAQRAYDLAYLLAPEDDEPGAGLPLGGEYITRGPDGSPFSIDPLNVVPMALYKDADGRLLQISLFRDSDTNAVRLLKVSIVEKSPARESLSYTESFSFAPGENLQASRSLKLYDSKATDSPATELAEKESPLNVNSEQPSKEDLARLILSLQTAKRFDPFE